MRVAPAVFLPALRTENIMRDVLRVCDYENSRHVGPRRVVANPVKGLHTGHQLHSIYAAFATPEVNDLLIGQSKVFGKMNNRGAT